MFGFEHQWWKTRCISIPLMLFVRRNKQGCAFGFSRIRDFAVGSGSDHSKHINIFLKATTFALILFKTWLTKMLGNMLAKSIWLLRCREFNSFSYCSNFLVGSGSGFWKAEFVTLDGRSLMCDLKNRPNIYGKSTSRYRTYLTLSHVFDFWYTCGIVVIRLVSLSGHNILECEINTFTTSCTSTYIFFVINCLFNLYCNLLLRINM